MLHFQCVSSQKQGTDAVFFVQELRRKRPAAPASGAKLCGKMRKSDWLAAPLPPWQFRSESAIQIKCGHKMPTSGHDFSVDFLFQVKIQATAYKPF